MSSIGLSELISKVKSELLEVPPGHDGELPFLFVDSIELELKVAVSKGGQGGINIEVLGIGGAKLDGNLNQENIQTVKVTLSSLFDKQKLIELYEKANPGDVIPALIENMKASIKGNAQGSADDEVI